MAKQLKLIFLASIATILCLFGCSQEASKPLDVGEYKPVRPQEIACVLKDYSYEGAVTGDGGISPTAGKIGQFLCSAGIGAQSVNIPLTKNEFQEGSINTVNFGKIKIFFENSISSNRYAIAMTDSQKEAIGAYLKKWVPPQQTSKSLRHIMLPALNRPAQPGSNATGGYA